MGTPPLLKIGLSAPFEGLGRPLGYEALAGVKLALAERNAAGGVGGYLVELVALNDYGEPDEARRRAREFAVDPAVTGVITGWTGEAARDALPAYQQVGLAVIVPWSVPSELADGERGIVLVAADAGRVADVLAEAVAATQPGRAVIVGEQPSAATYEEALNTQGVRTQIVPPPALDDESTREWATYLVLSRVRPPDAVILTTDGASAGGALLALAALDWRGMAFGGQEVGSAHLVDVAGDKATGLVFVSPAPAGPDGLMNTASDSSSNKHNLGPRGVLAYDAAHVLLDAIELTVQQEGVPSRQGVVSNLSHVQRQGLTGEIGFDQAGRRLDAPVWLYSIDRDGYPGQVLMSPQQ